MKWVELVPSILPSQMDVTFDLLRLLVSSGENNNHLYLLTKASPGKLLPEGHSVLITNISETDFKLSSGFGIINTKNLIAIPFLFEKLGCRCCGIRKHSIRFPNKRSNI